MKVATTGSFHVPDATIGDYEGNQSSQSNDFINVKFIGYANNVEVCETAGYSSIGVFVTDYAIDYTPCANIKMDSFRTYFTTSSAIASCYFEEFNLVNFTLAGASEIPPPANAVPTISDTTPGQAVNDNATVSPFSGVTLDDDAKGALSATSIASTSVANAQTTLRAITFNPADNRVVVGNTETTTFTITANDGSANGTDSTTTVVSTSINDTPTDIALRACKEITWLKFRLGLCYI